MYKYYFNRDRFIFIILSTHWIHFWTPLNRELCKLTPLIICLVYRKFGI